MLIPGKCDTFAGLNFKDKTIAAYTKANCFLKYNAVDLTNVEYFLYRYGTKANGYMEVHLNSLNGELINLAHMPTTGGWSNWKISPSKAKRTKGKQDVYFVFKIWKDPNALFDLAAILLANKLSVNKLALNEVVTEHMFEVGAKNEFLAKEDQKKIIRASTVANDVLQKALGRSNREIVTTNRASQISLLQALEFSNGSTLHTVIHKGASRFPSKKLDKDTLIQGNLYIYTWSQSFGKRI